MSLIVTVTMATRRLDAAERTALLMLGIPAMTAYVPEDTIPALLCDFMFKASVAAGFNGLDDDGEPFVTPSWTYQDTDDLWQQLCSTKKPLKVTRAFYLHHHHGISHRALLSLPKWAYWKYVE